MATDNIKFTNQTKAVDLAPLSGMVKWRIGMGNSSFSLELSPRADVNEGDIVLVQEAVNTPTFFLFQGMVDRISHERGPTRIVKRIECTGLTGHLSKSKMPLQTFSASPEDIVRDAIGALVAGETLLLNEVDSSGLTIESYTGSEFRGDVIKDMQKYTKFRIVEGYNSTNTTLDWATRGGEPTTLGVIEMSKKGAVAKLLRLSKNATGITNSIYVEGVRDSTMLREEWTPGGGETSRALTKKPAGPIRVYWKTSSAVAIETTLTGGVEPDGNNVDYYVDAENKTVHFTGHTVVGGGNVYYFEYTTRIPVSFSARDAQSISTYGERHRKFKEILIKTETDNDKLGAMIVQEMSKPELDVIIEMWFDKDIKPNQLLVLRERLADLDRLMLLEEVDIPWPISTPMRLKFGELRIPFEEYVAGIKDEMRRVDYLADESAQGLEIEGTAMDLTGTIRSTMTVSVGAAGTTQHYQTPQPIDGIKVI